MKNRLRDIRVWWKGLDRGGVGDEGSFRVRSSSQKEIEEQEEAHLTPAERLRKRFLKLREQSKTAFRREEESLADDDDD